MRLIAVGVLVALWQAVPAHASTCEEMFAKKGNPVTGLRYTAIHTVADLSAADAINQLRGIVLAKNYDVLAVEPDAGDMLMEMPQTEARRSFPITVKATTEGNIATVQLRANLRAGVFAKDEVVRGEMCAVLAELKGGAAGVTAATSGKNAAAGGGAPTVFTAQILADRLSKERDKNADEIPLRYKGRSFTVSGGVDQVRKDGDTYRVVFKILDWEEKALRLPGDSQFKTEIVCELAPGQSVYALSLTPSGRQFKLRSNVTLTGTYSDYRDFPLPSVFWLSDCKPAPPK